MNKPPAEPCVVYATIYPPNVAGRAEAFVTRELAREYLAEPRAWRLEVVVASAHAGSLEAARAVMAEFPSIPAEFWHLETEYAGTRAEEISFCKEQLPLRLSQRTDWDWLLFMDADVWTPICQVPEWIGIIGDEAERRFVKVKYCLRNHLTSPHHTLGAYFHHRALLERMKYWKVVFPKDANGKRLGAPDCYLHDYLEGNGCRKIVPDRLTTYHFLNAEDAHVYRNGALFPKKNARQEVESGDATRKALGSAAAADMQPFIHLVPYSLNKRIASAYNEAIERVTGFEWILLTDADVMFLVPDYGHLIEQVIQSNPGAGLITCLTNRVGAQSQLTADGVMSEPSLLRLREIALERRRKFGASVSVVPAPVSGMFMLFRRETWKAVGGFTGKGMLDVDWAFSRKIQGAGLPILRMDGLFVAHFYRLDSDTRQTKHLTARAG